MLAHTISKVLSEHIEFCDLLFLFCLKFFYMSQFFFSKYPFLEHFQNCILLTVLRDKKGKKKACCAKVRVVCNAYSLKILFVSNLILRTGHSFFTHKCKLNDHYVSDAILCTGRWMKLASTLLPRIQLL